MSSKDEPIVFETFPSQSAVLRRSRTWYSQRILALFSPVLTAEMSELAGDLLRRRRLVDFAVQTGRITAKVFDDLSRPSRIEIAFRQTSPEKWEKILTELAKQSYFHAVLLAGQLPVEMEEIFARNGAELFPSTLERLSFIVNGKKDSTVSKNMIALVLRLCERLDEDPFAILTLRGRGKEEVLLELRKRLSSAARGQQGLPLGYQHVSYEPAPPLVSTMDFFWSAGTGMSELSYSIKADELPAFVLKWLDPLPLGGLEDQIDFALEQAYSKVARLAQGFGLGL